MLKANLAFGNFICYARNNFDIVTMQVETNRYRISIDKIAEGGPGGYESVYLTSEGEPASQELFATLKSRSGKLLPAENQVIRQRNGDLLVDALKKELPVGIASGFKPSGAYHFGHKLTSEAVSFFQKNGVQVFVPVADIECWMDSKIPREKYQFWAGDNLLDWGANGVNLDAAHVYLQSEEFRGTTLAYIAARSLEFKLAVDIYGAEKLIQDFPFLFAGITQVGDILLPQHKDFGNEHSFMVSGQDQDGHMKMTKALTESTLASGADFLGVKSVPSGFYIPHIRGTAGNKASSSRSDSTIYLGAGPNVEEITDRIRSSLKKMDEADRDHLERCCLDMVRFIDFFNSRSRVTFSDFCSDLRYRELEKALSSAKTAEDRKKLQDDMDNYLIGSCRDQKQNNIEIVRDSLPEALTDHKKKREAILYYAKQRSKSPDVTSTSTRPDFWEVPLRAVIADNKKTPTKWYNMVSQVADKICP